ncbi:MAG: tetratricopeptide repeat protein [Lewinellaceae bacterium]|nr:tetratricopeptide repeat protein [Lewinellaceae bacterium]
MSIAIALWLFGYIPMQSQSAYERELWNTYNNAPDFPAQKTAFDKLEKFYRLFHLDSALVVCNQFRALAAQSQPDYVPFVDLRIAATYTRKLDLEKAGSILIPILEKAEQERNDSLRAGALLNLSNLNRAQKNYPMALQRGFEAAAIHEKLRDWREFCADYNAIASAYAPSQTDSNLFYLQKALAVSEQHQLPDVAGTVLNNIGVHFHIKGDLDKAISYYKRASVIDKKTDDRYGLCFVLLNIGHAYLSQQKWTEAKPWFDEAMPVCESCGNLEGVGSVKMGLADIYESLGDYKSALAAQKKLSEIDQQLNQQAYGRATQTLEARYGSEKGTRTERATRRKLSPARCPVFPAGRPRSSLGAGLPVLQPVPPAQKSRTRRSHHPGTTTGPERCHRSSGSRAQTHRQRPARRYCTGTRSLKTRLRRTGAPGW